MTLFRKKPSAETASPDEALPFFTRQQADRFRRVFAAAFAEQGLEAQVYPDYLVDERGREYGMHNAATACLNDERGEPAWNELMRDHAQRLLVAMDSPTDVSLLTTEEVHASVFPRLVDARSVGPLSVSYNVQFSEGVLELLNLDLPDSVMTLDDDRVAQHGGRAALRTSGVRNLLGVLPGLEVKAMSEGEASQLLVMSDSMFTASTVLVMPELLTQVGVGIPEHGVLVCMPFRHQVAIHAIRDASVVPSMHAMVGFAGAGYEEGAGPLTPHVFWWREGSFDQLTRIQDGGIAVDVGRDLQAVLAKVCD